MVEDLKNQLTQAVVTTLNDYPMAADAASLVTNAIKAQDINGLTIERLISESLNVKHRDEQLKAIRLADSVKGAMGHEIATVGPELGKSILSVDEEHIRIIAGDQEVKPPSVASWTSKHSGTPTSNAGRTVATGPQNSLNDTGKLSFAGLFGFLSGEAPISSSDSSLTIRVPNTNVSSTTLPSHGVVSTASTPKQPPRFSSLSEWGTGMLLSIGLIGSCAMVGGILLARQFFRKSNSPRVANSL